MQNLKERLIVAAMVSMLLLAALGGCGGREDSPIAAPPPGEATPPPDSDEVKPLLNHRAPEIEGVDVVTGETVRLSDLKGQVVMINFWATWCGPCRVEMPAMEAFHKEMGKEVRIIAVGADRRESPEMLSAFARELQLTFTILYDEGNGLRDYKLIGIPSTVFVDQNGIIRDKHTGVLNAQQMKERALQTRTLGQKE